MKRILIVLIVAFLFSCAKKNTQSTEPTATPSSSTLIKAVDISMYPEIKLYNIPFKNANNATEDILTTIKNNGVNTVRLRLWHTPSSATSSFNVVKKMSDTLKQLGFKIWLTVHYSDTWADPSQQASPQAWQGLSISILKDSLNNYTQKIMQQINPDYIQIGNEINSGFLFPYGAIANATQMNDLLKTASRVVRNSNANTKIILHYAGLQNAAYFFNLVQAVDYDYMGISYYPVWHNIAIDALQTQLNALCNATNKKVLIAETAYPFTLAWSDYTNNIVGLSSQLLTNYAATFDGQKAFLQAIKKIKNSTPNFIGFCYWAPEWVAYKGSTATDCSSWENQALWDFNFKETSALSVFKD